MGSYYPIYKYHFLDVQVNILWILQNDFIYYTDIFIGSTRVKKRNRDKKCYQFNGQKKYRFYLLHRVEFSLNEVYASIYHIDVINYIKLQYHTLLRAFYASILRFRLIIDFCRLRFKTILKKNFILKGAGYIIHRLHIWMKKTHGSSMFISFRLFPLEVTWHSILHVLF